MERKREGLVSIGEVIADLPGPVQSLQPSPPARHHFTQADQVNQLVEASEADPDLGFMARLMALCSLPRTNPGNRKEYKRVNGPFTLYMVAGGGNKLPFGNLLRLLLAWVCTEAVRTQRREIVLGKSLSEFMRTLDIYSNSGRVHTRLRNQMKRLFGCTVTMVYEEPGGFARVSSLVADKDASLRSRAGGAAEVSGAWCAHRAAQRRQSRARGGAGANRDREGRRRIAIRSLRAPAQKSERWRGRWSASALASPRSPGN